MEFLGFEVQSLSFVEAKQFWIVKVAADVQEDELRHNIATSVRVAGSKAQTLADVERLALEKAKNVLSLATNSRG